MAVKERVERPQPTIRLPLDLYYDLKKRADAEGMNFQPWLVVLLQAWLDANPPSVHRTGARYFDPFVADGANG